MKGMDGSFDQKDKKNTNFDEIEKQLNEELQMKYGLSPTK